MVRKVRPPRRTRPTRRRRKKRKRIRRKRRVKATENKASRIWMPRWHTRNRRKEVKVRLPRTTTTRTKERTRLWTRVPRTRRVKTRRPKKSEKDTASANARKQKQEKETEIEKQEQQQEQRQAPLKPKVKVILATTLKKELIKQYEALTHNRVLKLPREPAAHTVQSLFSDYEVEAIAKARTPKQIERAKEVVSGLKRYFDAALHKALLYEKEKKYYDVAIAKNDALKSKPASEICGAEHLLRLYVKLPDFIPVEAFVGQKGEKEAELIGHQLGETLRWLQKRSHEAFEALRRNRRNERKSHSRDSERHGDGRRRRRGRRTQRTTSRENGGRRPRRGFLCEKGFAIAKERRDGTAGGTVGLIRAKSEKRER